jgi:hypothetical protein
MRDLRIHDGRRLREHMLKHWGRFGDENCGAFQFASPTCGQPLRVVASSGCGWDHVSVSLPNRCPNWPEMEFIRRRFFKDDEAAMQYHASIADYVDGSRFGHPHCLHLWRPHAGAIPVPPKWMVGGMTREEAEQQMTEACK